MFVCMLSPLDVRTVRWAKTLPRRCRCFQEEKLLPLPAIEPLFLSHPPRNLLTTTFTVYAIVISILRSWTEKQHRHKQWHYYVKHLASFVLITVTQIYGGNWILTAQVGWSSDSPNVPLRGYLILESVPPYTRMAKIDCGESSLAILAAIKLSVVTCRLY